MIPWLSKSAFEDFPIVENALSEPDGLLAAGGDLTINRLLAAYRRGIFPWYSPGEPILWWSPSERMVIEADAIHVSKSMRRFLQKQPFEFRINSAFTEVIIECAKPRDDSSGTWIDTDMHNAYHAMHLAGHADSYECWQNGKLVGGVYGVHLGHMYFGESMFSRVTNASKAALIFAAQQEDISLIDCQFYTDHLASMGGKLISRKTFLEQLDQLI